MVYVPDDQNSLSLLSELSIYNPRLPFSMKCSGADFCQDNGEILMIVGEISKKQSRKPLEIVFKRAGTEVNRHPDLGFYSVINNHAHDTSITIRTDPFSAFLKGIILRFG